MPDISQITLPSGNTYSIKDTVARQAIAGGVTFIVAWNGSSTPVVADIPAGVKVKYNNVTYTGTLAAADAQAGAFYLVSSETQQVDPLSGDPVTLDVYDEYVPIKIGHSTYQWEKIGDTQLVLKNVVSGISISGTSTSVVTGVGASSTDTVLGTSTAFTVSGDNVDVVTGVSTTKASATASGAAISAVSGDNVTVVTGYASPTTDTFVKSVSAETDKYLDTTSLIGVQSSTTTASKATAATSQTTATGGWTAVTPGETDANSNGNPDVNENLLANISVSNETLTIGAATLNTQTTTQFTFADVTVPVKNSSATTVATGGTSTSGTGAAVVTGVTVGSSASALTGLGSPTTDTVIGTGSTFTVTQPTITLATGSTGDITVATGASGTDSVWGSSSAIAASGDNVTAVTGVSASTTTPVVKSITVTATMADGGTSAPQTYTAS